MPKQIGELKLYTVDELSSLLGIQERSIRKFLREGTLKGRKLGNRWFISQTALSEYFSNPPLEVETYNRENS